MTNKSISGSAINADESITTAARLVHAGEFARAIEILTPIVSSTPTRAALALLAESYQGLREYAEAATIRDLSRLMDTPKPSKMEDQIRVLPAPG